MSNFSQEAYTQNDKPGKDAVLAYLQDLGAFVRSIEDYSVDIRFMVERAAEVEVRSCWKTGQPFPFRTITVPARKCRLANSDLPEVDYYVVSADLTRALVAPLARISKAPVISKMAGRGKVEDFYDVPLIAFDEVSLQREAT